MIDLIFLAPSLLLAFVGIQRTIYMLSSLDLIARKQAQNKSRLLKTKRVHFFIFLPAHNEQSIVNETLNCFSKFDYSTKKTTLVVITSNSETASRQVNKTKLTGFCRQLFYEKKDPLSINRGLFPHYLFNGIKKIRDASTTYSELKKAITTLYNQFPTTHDLALEWLKKHKSTNLLLINDPQTKTTKASKLDYALRRLEKKLLAHKNTYIAIYDFDSRPDKRTLSYINNDLSVNDPKFIYQQLPIPVLDSTKVEDKSFSGLVTFIYSLMHIRRSLGIELRMHLRTLFENVGYLKYCLGAGMYINASKLVLLGGFPVTLDDIPLGYRASFLKLNTGIVPYFNYVSLNSTFNSLFGQSQNIFWAISMGIVEEFHWINSSKHVHINKLLAIWRSFYTIVHQHLIVLVLPLWTLVMVYFLLSGRMVLATVSVFLFYLSYGLPSIIVSKFINALRKGKYYVPLIKLKVVNIKTWILFLLAPIRGVVKAIILGNALYKNTINYMNGSKVVICKTER